MKNENVTVKELKVKGLKLKVKQCFEINGNLKIKKTQKLSTFNFQPSTQI